MPNLLLTYLDETRIKMEERLAIDNERWGETWRQRDVGGQEDRIYARFRDYFDQYKNAGVPIPWVKIACLAHIAMVRDDHPELLEPNDAHI